VPEIPIQYCQRQDALLRNNRRQKIGNTAKRQFLAPVSFGVNLFYRLSMFIKRKFLAKVVLSFASFSFHIKENEEDFRGKRSLDSSLPAGRFVPFCVKTKRTEKELMLVMPVMLNG